MLRLYVMFALFFAFFTRKHLFLDRKKPPRTFGLVFVCVYVLVLDIENILWIKITWTGRERMREREREREMKFPSQRNLNLDTLKGIMALNGCIFHWLILAVLFERYDGDAWNCELHNRERARERERETKRETKRERERETKSVRERERERKRQSEIETERKKLTERTFFFCSKHFLLSPLHHFFFKDSQQKSILFT